MSPSTVTTAVKWLEHTTMGLEPGPRADVTAPWGRGIANQHSWCTAWPLTHSCCLTLTNVALAVTPTLVLLLFSLPQWSHSSVLRALLRARCCDRQWDVEMNRT